MNETITKACPECGGALVIRTNGKTGGEFLSCVRWEKRDHEGNRRCTWTGGVPESVYLRRAGAMTLPGMD